MSARKPKFFVRIALKCGKHFEPNIDFKSLQGAKDFALGLIEKEPRKYIDYVVFEQ